MGEVIDLAGRREEPLVEQLQRVLSAKGSVTREVDQVDVEVAQWRRAARAAARQLKRPVRTGASGGLVWVVLADWPATDEEHAQDRRRLRRAVEATTPAGRPPRRHPLPVLYLVTEGARRLWVAYEDEVAGQLYVWVPNTGRFHRNRGLGADFYSDQDADYRVIDGTEARRLMSDGVGVMDEERTTSQLARYRDDSKSLSVLDVLGKD